MDEIEGLKMYLNTAEQDRLDRMRSPALTPEVFESFLPYAYALGVENRWCERFARELPEEVRQRSGYQPGWYSGQYHGMRALNHLGDSFSSSFSSAISSASSPPGSSSGSGGGGSSGGGGGGGGGRRLVAAFIQQWCVPFTSLASRPRKRGYPRTHLSFRGRPYRASCPGRP